MKYKQIKRKVFKNYSEARDILYRCERDEKIIFEAKYLNRDIRSDELMVDMQKHGYINIDMDTEDNIILTVPDSFPENVKIDTGANTVLISTTNKMFESYVGYGMRLRFSGGCAYARNRYGGLFFRTSLLKNVEIHGNNLRIETLNSVYVFELRKYMGWIKNKSVLATEEQLREVEQFDIRFLR